MSEQQFPKYIPLVLNGSLQVGAEINLLESVLNRIPNFQLANYTDPQILNWPWIDLTYKIYGSISKLWRPIENVWKFNYGTPTFNYFINLYRPICIFFNFKLQFSFQNLDNYLTFILINWFLVQYKWIYQTLKYLFIQFRFQNLDNYWLLS